MICAFENFYLFTEHDTLFLSPENKVEDMFKEAHSLEEFCLQLEVKKLSKVFMDKLIEYFEGQGRISYPDFDFFKKACDALLSKFLTDSTLNDNLVKCAVDQYIDNCGENRFTELTQQLIHTRRAYLEVSKFVEATCDPLDIEARFIYESWYKQLNLGRENLSSVDEKIYEMLQSDEKAFRILFLILCFCDENPLIELIKRQIISKLSSTLSVENFKLWKCFINLPPEKLKHIAVNFSDILDLLFDVITMSSLNFYCNYDEDKMIWLPKTSDSLSYLDICKLLNILYNVSDSMKNRVKNFLNSKKTTDRCLFFEDIENEVLRISLKCRD